MVGVPTFSTYVRGLVEPVAGRSHLTLGAAEAEGGPLFVSSCPVNGCGWKSDPLALLAHSLEARRGHLNGHAHSELVEFIAASLPARTERYERQP